MNRAKNLPRTMPNTTEMIVWPAKLQQGKRISGGRTTTITVGVASRALMQLHRRQIATRKPQMSTCRTSRRR
eukprot:6172875-Pleurochrysis_carterae.AAC.4